MITDALMTDKELGDPEDVIDLDYITVVVAKHFGSELANATFTSKHGSVLLNKPLPHYLSLECVNRIVSQIFKILYFHLGRYGVIVGKGCWV